MAEHRFHKAAVVGSIPTLGTYQNNGPMVRCFDMHQVGIEPKVPVFKEANRRL